MMVTTDNFGTNILGIPVIPSQRTLDYAAVTSDVTHLNPTRRRVTGRLIGLSHVDWGMAKWLSSARGRGPTGGNIVISFPSMPETIELARQAEYRVAPIYMAPDGIHQYLNTKPLEIPVQFSLSIHDHEYCEHGALTLLATAARLHALVLPVGSDFSKHVVSARAAGSAWEFMQGNNGLSTSTANSLTNGATTPPTTSAQKTNQSTTPSEPQKEQISQNSYGVSGGEASTYPPVACMLDLISDGRDKAISLGVSCIGYVNAVRTRFKGPWLQPPNGGKNMPSLLEADLTFVHFPGYTNRFAQNVQVYDQTLINAYAEEVRSNFYNLADKSIATNIDPNKGIADPTGAYRGLQY